MIFFKRHKRKQVPTPPTYHKFMMCFDLMSEDDKKEAVEILSQQTRPDKFCGERVPETLNGLSYGQLDDMRGLTEKDDIVYKASEIIFGRVLDIQNEDVNKVFGFLNFVTAELKRINELFQSIAPEHTPEERQAGIDLLDFGSFGVLDWYAKRMGIINQNDVRSVSWVRIFQCMKNDHETQMFEKRLQDVYMHKNRVPSGGKRR